MANPASFAITDLVANSAITEAAGGAVDTDGTVPIAAVTATDRLFIYVINTDNAALTVKVLAGDDPPAWRQGIGDLSVAMAATGTATDKRMIGPFESARFLQNDGTVNLNFTAATGAPACTVIVYRLPVV